MIGIGKTFETYEAWLSWWMAPGPTPAFVCLDAAGRPCRHPSDFARARDDGAFPVHMVLETEVSVALASAMSCLKEVRASIATLEAACGLPAEGDAAIDALELRLRTIASGCARGIGAVPKPEGAPEAPVCVVHD
jgi:hypothetical protein